MDIFLFDSDNILEISCGGFHTLILTFNKKMIGFGDNSFGQIGMEETQIFQEYIRIPIQIELPKLRFNENISNYHISCGEFNSFLYYSPPSFSNLEEDLIKLFEEEKNFVIFHLKPKMEK
ncbi:protein fmp25 [Anaeramoeba ignava]|uniref:Protein fmp25 n=1 Tax=Anaeramoeba ignava TaxID=1746090 RepID=A0A9Q0RD83_ANAIG|nr:protein fmp25 [Anaeramoeba ignava]